MRRHVEGLHLRGVDAVAIDLPRGRAERAAPLFMDFAGAVVGGHSFGGRAASLAAAEPASEFAGLLLFSYPLARYAQARTSHFAAIRCPVLMLSGDRDELSPAGELAAAAARLQNGRLVLLPGAGHSLDAQLERALDLAAAFVVSLGG